MLGRDGIHGFNRLAPTLVVEIRGTRHQWRERQAGQAIFGPRLQEFMQGLSDRWPHVGIVIERVRKPSLSGRNGKADVFEFDSAARRREALPSKVASQGAQASPQNLFKERGSCSVLLERRFMAGALGFAIGNDRFLVASLLEFSKPEEASSKQAPERLIPLWILLFADCLYT